MTRIQELMSKAPFTCHGGTPLREVARIMWDKDCGFMPVVNPKTQAVEGVLTDRDICMAAYTKARPVGNLDAAAVMSRSVHTCRQDDELQVAHGLMRKHQVRRLPVVDGQQRLVGVLSLDDMAVHALAADDAAERQELARTLGEVSRHRLPMAMPVG